MKPLTKSESAKIIQSYHAIFLILISMCGILGYFAYQYGKTHVLAQNITKRSPRIMLLTKEYMETTSQLALFKDINYALMTRLLTADTDKMKEEIRIEIYQGDIDIEKLEGKTQQTFKELEREIKLYFKELKRMKTKEKQHG